MLNMAKQLVLAEQAVTLMQAGADASAEIPHVPLMQITLQPPFDRVDVTLAPAENAGHAALYLASKHTGRVHTNRRRTRATFGMPNGAIVHVTAPRNGAGWQAPNCAPLTPEARRCMDMFVLYLGQLTLPMRVAGVVCSSQTELLSGFVECVDFEQVDTPDVPEPQRESTLDFYEGLTIRAYTETKYLPPLTGA